LAIATSAHLIVNFLLQFLILEKVTARRHNGRFESGGHPG